jgi:two-component system, LytTR family, response regulator
MLHALIIDDEENGLKSLELLIEKFIPEIKVVATTSEALKSVELINNYRPDIVFLDINMPNLNGFEVLDKLSFRNFHLIFTTAHEEYALRAIKQRAIDYLLKPIDAEELRTAVIKVKKVISEKKEFPDALSLLSSLNEQATVRVSVPTKTRIDLVSANEILYIEADSNNASITFTNGNQTKVTRSLKEYEETLCTKDGNFMRIHNSFIINVDYITRYIKEDGGYAVLGNKKSIPISKQKKEEFLKRINLKNE